jgi:hypothetical protein
MLVAVLVAAVVRVSRRESHAGGHPQASVRTTRRTNNLRIVASAIALRHALFDHINSATCCWINDHRLTVDNGEAQ